MVLIVFTIASGLLPAAHVQANHVLQGVPRLDGFQVYFTEAGGETSRFDRTELGLSRLAGLLELQGAELYTLEWRNGAIVDTMRCECAGKASD